jgi:hypothetical protein
MLAMLNDSPVRLAGLVVWNCITTWWDPKSPWLFQF